MYLSSVILSLNDKSDGMTNDRSDRKKILVGGLRWEK